MAYDIPHEPPNHSAGYQLRDPAPFAPQAEPCRSQREGARADDEQKPKKKHQPGIVIPVLVPPPILRENPKAPQSDADKRRRNDYFKPHDDSPNHRHSFCSMGAHFRRTNGVWLEWIIAREAGVVHRQVAPTFPADDGPSVCPRVPARNCPKSRRKNHLFTCLASASSRAHKPITPA